MAMIQCPECQQSVSELAPNCPNCGAPIASRVAAPAPLPAPQKKSGCLKIGCLVLAGLCLLGLILSALVGNNKGPGSPSSTTSTSTAASTAASATEPESQAGAQWTYRTEEDPMTGDKTYYASVKSTNTVNFSFPYAGAQHGTLTLRTHPRHGKDAIFQIERGQIPCHSFSPCKALIRFDDKPAVNYEATGPEDNSTETIFLRDYSGFVGKLSKARTVRLSVNVFQEGSPVFEFDVSGFDANKYRPPAK